MIGREETGREKDKNDRDEDNDNKQTKISIDSPLVSTE
jgi:hypothetical protein